MQKLNIYSFQAAAQHFWEWNNQLQK